MKFYTRQKSCHSSESWNPVFSNPWTPAFAGVTPLKILHIMLCLLFLFLTGCGFHLRGHDSLPSSLQNIYLDTGSPYSELSKQLRQTLHAHHIVTAADPADAQSILTILNEDFSEQATSTSSTTQVTTYTLFYTLRYTLEDQRTHKIIGPRAITTTQTYAVNASQVLSSIHQKIQLQQALRTQAINLLLFQIGK